MASLSTEDLPWPPDCHRVDLALPDFESEDDARVEDSKRAKLLFAAARKATKEGNKRAALNLARRLDYGDGEPPKTIASNLYMRDQRIRVVGQLWKLCDLPDFGPPVLFHLTPDGHDADGFMLGKINPNRKTELLRTDLNRALPERAPGYLFACLDGEYPRPKDHFRLHFHGLAAGGMVDGLEALRRTPKYVSTRIPGLVEPNPQRVVVTRKVDNVPRQLCYLVKGFWGARWEGVVNGEWKRGKRKRIPEPDHARVLLWQDRWGLDDMTLRMGLRIGRKGLRPSDLYMDESLE